MSASPPKADMLGVCSDVGYVPEADIRPTTRILRAGGTRKVS